MTSFIFCKLFKKTKNEVCYACDLLTDDQVKFYIKNKLVVQSELHVMRFDKDKWSHPVKFSKGDIISLSSFNETSNVLNNTLESAKDIYSKISPFIKLTIRDEKISDFIKIGEDLLYSDPTKLTENIVETATKIYEVSQREIEEEEIPEIPLD